MQIVLETAALLLCYHPVPKIVHHEFRRFVHGTEFREVLEKGLEVLAANGACKWLSDDRRNGPIKPSDAEWSANDWVPRATAAGWKYWAVVLPLKVLGQMNMNRWVKGAADQGLTAQGFTELPRAQRWLEAQ